MFSHIIEDDKRQKTNYKGPKSFMTNFLQIIWSFP